MSEENLVASDESADQNEAAITIRITEERIRYDTNLSLPETVMWLRAVETMIMKKVLAEDE